MNPAFTGDQFKVLPRNSLVYFPLTSRLQLLGNKARTGAEKRSSASMQKAERI
jgi:hypothetical protein